MSSQEACPHAISRVLPTVAGALCVAALGIVFAISFVALIYTGPLSSFLGPAIVMTLIGSAIMVVVGALLHRLPALASPQDTTALLLAGSLASVTAADPDALNGPTVAALIALITAITGIAVYTAGRMRVGYLARYIPYPVLGGFLAATGYLLTTGAVGLLLDRSIHITDLPGLLAPDTAMRWLPWLVLAGGIVLATRIFRSDLTLPLCVLAVGAGFYLWLSIAGIDMAGASARGWLLGPFPQPEGGRYSLTEMLSQVDPAMMVAQLPLVFAVVALTLIGSLLNMSGFEVALKRRTDLDADLRAVGLSNLAASMGGGLVGWPLIGNSLLAARFNLPVVLSAGGVALASLAAVVMGQGVLEMLPRGLFATLVGFLGIDLLVQWLWTERRSFPARDFAVLLLILGTAMTVGFLTAIAVGIGAAAVLFVASYARLDPVRARTSGVARRSVIERAGAEEDRLTAAGESIVILELSGFIFFGSAYRLSQRVEDDIAAGGVSELIVDFKRVAGVDVSAIRSIGQIAEACDARGVHLILSAVPAGAATLIARQGGPVTEMAETLDDALRAAEDRVLAMAPETAPSGVDAIIGSLVPTVSLAPGERLFAEGSTSTAMFILCSGTARAEVATDGPEPLVVRRHMPGSMIGEIAFCTGLPRTASVVAETACDLAVVDEDRLDDMALDRAAFYALVAARLGERLARTTRLLQQLSH